MKKFIVLIITVIILLSFYFSDFFYNRYGTVKDSIKIENNDYTLINKRKFFTGHLFLQLDLIFGFYLSGECFPNSFVIKKNNKVVFRHEGFGEKLMFINEKLYLIYSVDGPDSFVVFELRDNSIKIKSERKLPAIKLDFYIFDEVENQVILIDMNKDIGLYFLSLETFSLKKLDINEYGYIYNIYIKKGKLYVYFINYRSVVKGKINYFKYCIIDLFEQEIIKKEIIDIPKNDVGKDPIIYYYEKTDGYKYYFTVDIYYNYVKGAILYDLISIYVLKNDGSLIKQLLFTNLQYYEVFDNFITVVDDGKIYNISFNKTKINIKDIGYIDKDVRVDGITFNQNDEVKIFGYKNETYFKRRYQYEKDFVIK